MEFIRTSFKKYKTFCVGDDAQAIYGFRGADFENIHSFQNRIPNSLIIKLEDNYRSTQEILDLSNWLLESSPIKYEKKLKAVLGKGKKPELHDFPNIFQESAWIAKDLMKRFKTDNMWHNKLVLVRSAFSGRSIEVECLKNSIPYIFIGGQKLLEAAHIKDLISLLRIAANYKDELAWHRFLTLFNGIGEVTANKIISKVTECSETAEVQNLFNSLFVIDCGIKLVYKKLTESESLSDSIDIAISFLNDLLMYKYGANEWQERKKDFDYLKQLSQNYTSLEDFIEEFMVSPAFTSQENSSEQKDFVTISTIHSAKGSESDIVYIADVTSGKYPSARDIDSLDAIEEERRVLYVAMTRAKKSLVITRNVFSMKWGDERLFNELKYKYFLNGLPALLVNEVKHEYDEIEIKSYTKKSMEEVTSVPKKFYVKISSVKKLTAKAEFQKSSISSSEKEYKNPVISEYMKSHIAGDLYPNEIKEAILKEYIPNVYGFVRIGKKYGINSDVIKDWYRKRNYEK